MWSQENVIKLKYFLTYSGFASWIILFNIYLADKLQLTGLQIGSIIALQQFNAIWVVPIWGLMADKFGKKKMYITSMLGSALALILFYFPFNYYTMLLCMLILSMFYPAISILIDSIALDHVMLSHKSDYGMLRLWASLGWAIGSFGIGKILNSQNIDYIFAIASTLLTITAFISVLGMKESTQINKSTVKLSHILLILKTHTRLRWYLLLILIAGVASSPTFLFVNMYYVEIKATYSQTGLAFMAQSLAELPVFYFAANIIRKYGTRNTLQFTFIILALRLAGYGLSESPITSVIIGISHGVTFALMYVAIITLVQSYFPSELRASGQSLVYSFYFGFGVVIGNLLIGYIKDHASMQQVMYIMSIVSALLVVSVHFFSKSEYYKKLPVKT